MNDLSQAIIRALCLADTLDASLSVMEISAWLDARFALREIAAALEGDPELKTRLAEKNGFYCLRGREELLELRAERLAIAEEKWVVAKRALGRIRYLPWLRLAAVVNTVAMGFPKRESDVDLFIVAAPGRLWLVRLLLHAALAINSLARRGASAADRICLSFSVTTRALALGKLAKQPRDPYLALWLATLVPAIERDSTYQKLLAANSWLAEYLPNAAPRLTVAARTKKVSVAALILEIVLWPFGSLFEFLARAVERPRILANPNSRLRLGGTDVVVTDDVLKFHEEDRRDAIREKYRAKVAEYAV